MPTASVELPSRNNFYHMNKKIIATVLSASLFIAPLLAAADTAPTVFVPTAGATIAPAVLLPFLQSMTGILGSISLRVGEIFAARRNDVLRLETIKNDLVRISGELQATNPPPTAGMRSAWLTTVASSSQAVRDMQARVNTENQVFASLSFALGKLSDVLRLVRL